MSAVFPATSVTLPHAGWSASRALVYNDKVVRQFSVMAVVWGVVTLLVGVFIAAQMAWPELNFGISWLSFGRLRPVHTNAGIFAFGGCALFATSYTSCSAPARCGSFQTNWRHFISGAGTW